MKLNWMSEQKLVIEIFSLQRATESLVMQQMFNKKYELVEDPTKAIDALRAVETFARRAREILTTEGNVVEGEVGSAHVLGSHTRVVFPSLNNTEVDGKVDTGATSSSLHATDVQANGDRVSFKSELISPNVITLPLDGTQEVHSADFGGDQRPVVRLDVEVDGVPLKGVPFNLNDRSKMDAKLLIGQDILKAGNFQVDVGKGDQESAEPTMSDSDVAEAASAIKEEEQRIYEAICLLVGNDITLGRLVEYLRVEALNRIKE